MNHRRNRWKKTLIIIECCITAVAIAAAVYEGILLKESISQNRELQERQKTYENVLYVAVSDLQVGNILSEEHVKEEVRYTDEPRTSYMTKEDFGKQVVVAVSKGACLMKSMLSEVEENLREVEIKKIDIPDYLQEGDRVDVRISYGNAEDYVVLAGKHLIRCDEKTGIVVSMNEEEILLLSSALNDCEKYRETGLYLVKYPDKSWTGNSNGNYIPNKEVLLLLKNAGWLNCREELEQRLEK